MPPRLDTLTADPILGKYLQTPAAPAAASDLESDPVLGKYVQSGAPLVPPDDAPETQPEIENRQAVTNAERSQLRNLRPSPESAVEWLKARGYDARVDETGDVAVRKPGDPTFGRIEPSGFLAGEGAGGKFVELIKDLGPDAVDDYLEGLAITKGAALGTAGGAAVGSVVPGVGTALGGVAGLAGGGAAASAATEAARAVGRKAAGFQDEDLSDRLTEAAGVGAIGAVGGKVIEKVARGARGLLATGARRATRFSETVPAEAAKNAASAERLQAEAALKDFDIENVVPFREAETAVQAERAGILEKVSRGKARAAAYRRPAEAAKLSAQATLRDAEALAAEAKVGTAAERGVFKEATATEARTRATLERLKLEHAQRTEQELAAVAPEVEALLARGEAVAVSHPGRVTTMETTRGASTVGGVDWPVEIIRPDYGITAAALATPNGRKILTLLNKHFPDLVPTDLDAEGNLVKFGTWAMKERRDQLARFFKQLGPEEFDRRASGYIKDLARLTLGDDALLNRLKPDAKLLELLARAAKGDRSAPVVEAVSRVTQRTISGTIMSPDMKAAKAAQALARVEKLEARAGALEAGLSTTPEDFAVERAKAALKAAEAKAAHRKSRGDVALSGRRQRADVALQRFRHLAGEKQKLASRRLAPQRAKQEAQAKEARASAKLERIAPAGVRGRDAALTRDLVRRSFSVGGAGVGLAAGGLPGAALGFAAGALAGSTKARAALARIAGAPGLRISTNRMRAVLRALENRQITNRTALLAALRE